MSYSEEVNDLFDSLKAFDAEIKNGNLYPQCPRCNGDRTVSAMTRYGHGFYRNTYEEFACPVCSGMGESCQSSGSEWLLRKLEDYELDDEQLAYLRDRKNIVQMET
jgi:hypothetical protein